MKNLVPTLLQKLKAKRQTLSLSESCTGGLISTMIVAESGASRVYMGGLVTYSNQAKQDILGVNGVTLRKYGAVSGEIAEQMARGTKKRFRSDWSIAVTGIAGPTGGTREKPVGLVFIAVHGPTVEEIRLFRFKGSRSRIQRLASKAALKLLLENV